MSAEQDTKSQKKCYNKNCGKTLKNPRYENDLPELCGACETEYCINFESDYNTPSGFKFTLERYEDICTCPEYYRNKDKQFKMTRTCFNDACKATKEEIISSAEAQATCSVRKHSSALCFMSGPYLCDPCKSKYEVRNYKLMKKSA